MAEERITTEAKDFAEWQKWSACKVCGNEPDEDGVIEHGRGCYVVNEDGGGCTCLDVPTEYGKGE
jgi:hypothetical protein